MERLCLLSYPSVPLLTAVDGASHVVARERVEEISCDQSMGTKVCGRISFQHTSSSQIYECQQQSYLIIDIVNRLGLAHPEISFSLISDGKEDGTGQLRKPLLEFMVWLVPKDG